MTGGEELSKLGDRVPRIVTEDGDGIARQRVGEHLHVEGQGILGHRRTGHRVEVAAQGIHLMQVRELRLRVDIAHESDVEDVAQVAEGLARADLAARVGWEYEGLGEEEHLEAGRRIRPLDRAPPPPTPSWGTTNP